MKNNEKKEKKKKKKNSRTYQLRLCYHVNPAALPLPSPTEHTFLTFVNHE